MSSVYVLVDIAVAVDLSSRHEQELRGMWATALRLPASAVLLLSSQGDGKGFRLAVRVDSESGETIDDLFERIKNVAQVNTALRALEVRLMQMIALRLLSPALARHTQPSFSQRALHVAIDCLSLSLCVSIYALRGHR